MLITLGKRRALFSTVISLTDGTSCMVSSLVMIFNSSEQLKKNELNRMYKNFLSISSNC